MSKIKNGGLDQ